MPAMLRGRLAAWGRILTKEIDKVERMQSKTLKQLLKVLISTSTAVVLMKTGTWSAKEYSQNITMMLYHNITNRKNV